MIKESGIVERLDGVRKVLEAHGLSKNGRAVKEAATLIAELQAERDELQIEVFELKHGVEDQMEEAAYHRERRAEAESSLDRVRETTWQPIETAPKDGTEINGYRPDQGVFTFRWAFMDELVSHDQNGDPVEDFNDHEGWWHDRWGWMEGELSPTHWQPLPATPPQHTDAVAPSRAAGGDA